MKKIFIISIALTMCNMFVNAQPFTLPKLNYEYKALEPNIDAQTMEIHHTKHHQAYVTNLNKAIVGTKAETLKIEELMINASKRSDAIRNNAGGHYNHSLFWEILSPTPSEASMEFTKAVNSTFVSMDSLKKLLTTAASTRFGSGWAWLIVTPDKKLVVHSTGNQDNAIMDVSEKRGIPILGIDVWEHAYYLKYQNKRGDYLSAIWNVLDWGAVSKKYAEAKNNPFLKVIEKDAWKELKDFHMVMAQTFHPAEEGKFEPIRERIGEMVSKAKLLNNNPMPTSFATPEMKKATETILKGAEEINKLVSKKADNKKLMDKLTKLHDDFHVIQGLCEH